MKKRVIAAALIMLLVVAIAVPSVLFIAPRKASAQTSAISCIAGLLGIGGAAVNTIVAVPVSDFADTSTNGFTAGSTIGSCIYQTIVVPLIRMAIRALLQQITASTINWINGGNGTGQPSYVRNLSVHLQGVGDSSALAFISQAGTAFNSPFGSVIASSLQANYLQQTSMAGFYAANQCTLAKSSPNVNGFLAGDWSQGGVAAWFALTTQDQNNPYTLYEAAQNQMNGNVSQAQTNRRQDLAQSNGFLSWCGGSSSSSGGVANPSAPCTNKDGTPAMANTPGSLIHDYTQKAVTSSGIDQLISANDIDGMLMAIGSTILNKVIGGAGGLFGSSQGGSASVTRQIANTPIGSTSATASTGSLAQQVLANVNSYTASWNTILAAANTASTNVTSFMNGCAAQSTTAQATLTNTIAPVIAQAQAALSQAATTQALALQVQAETTATTADGALTLSTDTQTLSTMPPTGIDVSQAQSAATATNGATANPSGSLSISGGSLLDEMNLISANAQALLSSCTAPPPPDTSAGAD